MRRVALRRISFMSPTHEKSSTTTLERCVVSATALGKDCHPVTGPLKTAIAAQFVGKA
jgi:hypothetical protein